MAVIDTTRDSEAITRGLLVQMYIDVKENPGKLLPPSAIEWTKQVCQPSAKEPYGETLTFTEAFEKYAIPSLPKEAKRKLEMVLMSTPKASTDDMFDISTYRPSTSVYSRPSYPIDDWNTSNVPSNTLQSLPDAVKELLERVDQLEADVAMLKSQNAFADKLSK